MGKLSYVVTMSLDGYVADADGNFDWSAPSDSVFDLHVARLDKVTTEILGRKTYELMEYWEHYDEPDGTDAEHDFARGWRELDKIVVSSQLAESQLFSERDRLVPALSVDEIREIVAQADGVVEIFGPTTAAEAISAGIVDVFEFFVVPMIVGGGLRALPDGFRNNLRLTEAQVFDSGTVYGQYEPW